MSDKQLSLFEKLKSFQLKQQKSSPKKTNKRKKGDEAEDIAFSFLLKQGLNLLERNYNTRVGEVDLIMQDKTDPETLIFIEVRYRKNQDFGGAAASVTFKKQQRITKAALSYQQQNAPQSSMRFDVVAVEGDNMEINWVKSAFDGF